MTTLTEAETFHMDLLSHRIHVLFLRAATKVAEWEPAPCPPDYRPELRRR